MSHYLGIDMGTTGLKALLVREDGSICGSAYQEYPIATPAPGYAEQDPEDWWRAVRDTCSEALRISGLSATQVRGIGLSGQMHGTVLLDKRNRLLGPAVIWCDQRAIRQVEEMRSLIGTKALGAWTQNPVAAGFQAVTLMWLKANDPELYAQARHVLLPKDYIRLRLTGTLGTEPTDACSTLLFDCAARTWSSPVLSTLGIDPELLPPIYAAPTEVQGGLCAQAAEELGLHAGTPVVLGGGDQPMQAVGNGILTPGDASVTLGTGGQIFVPTPSAIHDPQLRVHMFCHAPQQMWYMMGAILNCCLAQNWFLDKVLEDHDFQNMHSAAALRPVGSGGLLFLPYLTGERTPHMNANARGAFFGLTLSHDRVDMARAVVEGISYALLDAMTCIEPLVPPIDRLILSGGGARSTLWKQIIADMMDRPIYTTCMTEAAGIGAAICAMVGTGAYPSLSEACEAIVRYDHEAVMPIAANTAYYREHFEAFRSLYRLTIPLLEQ